MSTRAGRGPVWLFSFVDLAFLLLIAMTQLEARAPSEAPDLGEIRVPEIKTTRAQPLAADAVERWQLRVYPEEAQPFALSRGVEPDAADEERFAWPVLNERLAALREERARKPVLAPHESSRSADLLAAAELLEDYWPSARRAAIAPVSALR